ncbi:hypothetical protein [Stenotrophomonas nematodicola]|uniref:Uncharacterized protein n=1 Tax=Stenotrophomonas nematodicola TaxID=2656746 RepID=A0ABW7D1T1_9GAMM
MSGTEDNLTEVLRELHARTAALEITVTALTRSLIATGALTLDMGKVFNAELEARLAQIPHDRFQADVRRFGNDWWQPLFATMKKPAQGS